MALLTVGSELAAMKISVAILALRANIAEDHVGVARGAGDAFVQPAQWESRLRVVVELGNGADGAPACGGVAVAARNLYGTVRISDIPVLRCCWKTQQQEDQVGRNYQPTVDFSLPFLHS